MVLCRVSISGEEVIFYDFFLYPLLSAKMKVGVRAGLSIFSRPYGCWANSRVLSLHFEGFSEFWRSTRAYAGYTEKVAMKSYPVPIIDPKIVDDMQRRIDGGASQEEVLGAMRSGGLFIGQSIKLVMRLYDLPLREARDLVHYSDTWADCRESNDQLQETLLEALEILAKEQDATVTESDEMPKLQEAS